MVAFALMGFLSPAPGLTVTLCSSTVNSLYSLPICSQGHGYKRTTPHSLHAAQSLISEGIKGITIACHFYCVLLGSPQDPWVRVRMLLSALTLAQRDCFIPVKVALGVLGAGGGAVADETITCVTSEANRAAGVQTRLAENQPVGWRLREATVRSWREGQRKNK